MFRTRPVTAAVLALTCAALSGAPNPPIRQPLGVYVHLDVDDAISGYTGSPSPTPTQLHAYLGSLYANLLANPAISGITIGAHWDEIQLAAGTASTSFDWSYLDDAFTAASAAHKTVQLIITPGFDTPKWLLSQLSSCDPLFTKGTAPSDCGTVTFAGFPEEQRADGKVLPLPWNTVYQTAWTAFLMQLNARYASNTAFVAIAIAGPVGASDEIILPTSQNDTATQPSGLAVDDTWAALLQHSFPSNPAYQNSEQAFIDAWKQAIDASEKIFTGVTLFISADAGNDLPTFSSTVTAHSDNTIFAQDCSEAIQGARKDLMSCEAKTEILSYFLAAAGPNGKATQVGGMTASSPLTLGDIGIAGVKLLTGLTPVPSPPFEGGAEFDYALTGPNRQSVGCPNPNAGCPGLTVEQAAYNVLAVFFAGTPAAAFYGGTVGSSPIHYLEADYTDVQYALANPCPPAPGSTIGNTSLQDLLNRASHDLFAMANQAATLPPPTCSSSMSTPIGITTGSQLPPGTVGVAYSQTLAASGGTGTYAWTLSSGTLPDGLTLSTAGIISGTPSTPGSSTFIVAVTDSSSASATLSATVVIQPAATPPVTTTVLRRPLGIYVVINVEDEIATLTQANPAITTTQLDAGFNSFYQALLDNPAVAGLALRPHWDTLNPNPPGATNAYYWNLVDDAFNQAAAWNAQNPSLAPKTIQLIVTPGFQSPQWILDQIPSCDGLFQTPVVTPPGTCGKVTFAGFSENGDGDVLPLPWNPVYKTAWQTFLSALQARYGSNPLLVSIAVGGPTAASVEMDLPNDGNSNNPQTQFGTPITPSKMWVQLQTFHYPGQTAYQGTNQAFVDEWNNAIDMYGRIFNGLTLVVTTGNGFPDFNGAAVNIPPAFAADCSKNQNPACAAATTILQYFMQPAVGGANAKATQDSGFAAARVGSNLGLPAVKQLSQMTAQLTPGPAQVLGGSQFSTTFSIATLTEGCTSVFPPNSTDTPADCTIPPGCITNNCVPVQCIPQACLAPGVTVASLASFGTAGKVPAYDLISPEQALYNLLSFYFDGTPAAAAFAGTPGAAPMNYLQIYYEDIQYTTANAQSPGLAVEGGNTVSVTAQSLLNLTSQKLFSIAEPASPPAIPIAITTASPLPPGIVGIPYLQTLAASGGTPPFNWTLSSGSLPSGLSVSATGQITGTPIASGSSSAMIQVTDSNGLTATQAFMIAVTAPPSLLLPSPDSTTVFDPVNNINWLANFNLASTNRFGLSVCTGSSTDAKTCINPSGSMSYRAASAWVKAMNAANYLGQTNWQLPTTPLTDSTCGFTGPQSNSFGWGCSLSALGSLYNALGLSAPDTAVPITNTNAGPFINFQPALYWSQTSGLEPTGATGCCGTFSFNNGWQGSNIAYNFLFLLPMIPGPIAGTPTASGTGLQVNPGGQTVYDPIANVTWLADANLAASNTFGLPPCTAPGKPQVCVAQDGAMNFASATQFIENMNTAAYLGQSNWQVPTVDPTCDSSYACSVTTAPFQTLYYTQFALSPGTPVVATPATAVGPFTGIQPYLYWTCQAATVQSPCQSSGPAQGFEWSFWFGNGFEGTDVLAHDMYAAAYFTGTPAWLTTPVISASAQLPMGTVGAAYSQSLTAIGGAPPYTWTLTLGTLPPGLALTPDGTISGTPLTGGTSSFTVQVTDSNANSSTLPLTLVIQPAPSPLPLTNGVYLGMWANPTLGKNQEAAIEVLESAPPAGIGRSFNLHLVYVQWAALAAMLDSNGVFQPTVPLAGDISHGRVPVVSWSCDSSVANSNHVIAGGDAGEDAIITASALALKQYPGPVILRWFWEFNLLANNQSCRGDTGGKPTQQVYNDFTGAWQHIRTLFLNAGATNVIFLWNPGSYNEGGNTDPHSFYPGNQYVDWIGIDSYQRQPGDTFDTNFGQFYNDFSNSQYANKPLMVGENAVQNYSTGNIELQAPYLQGLLASIESGKYPLLAAYDYFDAPGSPPGSWVLDDDNGTGNGGLAELAMLAANVAFTPAPAPVSTSVSISTSAQLLAGTVGVPYSLPLAATGGLPPYTWTVSAGTLPDGLKLASDGAIAGTPTATGSSSFTVHVIDSQSATSTLAVTLIVQP